LYSPKVFLILKVIKYAVEVDADASRFPSDWLFHVRWGKKPGDVNGKYQVT
jgi:formamidopyrimidine-DNA glycosylase